MKRKAQEDTQRTKVVKLIYSPITDSSNFKTPSSIRRSFKNVMYINFALGLGTWRQQCDVTILTSEYQITKSLKYLKSGEFYSSGAVMGSM